MMVRAGSSLSGKHTLVILILGDSKMAVVVQAKLSCFTFSLMAALFFSDDALLLSVPVLRLGPCWESTQSRYTGQSSSLSQPLCGQRRRRRSLGLQPQGQRLLIQFTTCVSVCANPLPAFQHLLQHSKQNTEVRAFSGFRRSLIYFIHIL